MFQRIFAPPEPFRQAPLERRHGSPSFEGARESVTRIGTRERLRLRAPRPAGVLAIRLDPKRRTYSQDWGVNACRVKVHAKATHGEAPRPNPTVPPWRAPAAPFKCERGMQMSPWEVMFC